MHKLTFLLAISALSAATILTAQRFADQSVAAGIESVAVHPELMAGGVVWLDYNGDYYPDLLFTNGMSTPALFRNNWDGTFTKQSIGNVPAMGAVAATL
ncbi:MAG: hypothetical protein AAFZ52_18040 [Bacteroidota bacterium]